MRMAQQRPMRLIVACWSCGNVGMAEDERRLSTVDLVTDLHIDVVRFCVSTVTDEMT